MAEEELQLQDDDIGIEPREEFSTADPTQSNGCSETNDINTVPAYRELLDYHNLQHDNSTPVLHSKLKKHVHKFLPQPLYNALKPPLNRKEWKKFWLVHVPILHWLYYYVPKYLIGDVVAGLTIGVTHIPQGIRGMMHTCMEYVVIHPRLINHSSNPHTYPFPLLL